jgi:hypothetical protein
VNEARIWRAKAPALHDLILTREPGDRRELQH